MGISPFEAIKKPLRTIKRRFRKTARPFVQGILAGERMVGVDVGAAYGLQPTWVPFHGSVHFLCFEPHAESREKLDEIFTERGFRDYYRILPHGLSGTGGERTLYLSNVPTGASILPLNRDGFGMKYVRPGYYFPMREEKIRTHRLEDVLDELGEPVVDIIKLDTQGSEHEILRGMGRARMDHLIHAEIEVPLHDTHRDQTNFSELDRFMIDHGMELMNFTVARSHRPKDGHKAGYQESIFGVYQNSPKISARAWELDGIWFRRPEPLIEAGDCAAVRKLIVAYCAYNYFSEAYYVLEQAERRAVFSPQESTRLKSLVFGWHRALHYRIWHRPTPLFNWIRARLKKHNFGMTWSQYTWSDPPGS